MHPQVIGVRVAALVVAVGEDDLRLGAPDHGDQPAGGLVDVGHVERVRVLVRRRVGHPGVPVAEHHHLVEADDAGRLGELGRAHRGDLGLLLLGRQPVERLALGTQRRVLQLALLAAGAAHEHRVDALGVVAGDRRRALRRLVVGVGVDGEQGEPRGGAGLPSSAGEPGGHWDRHPFDVIRAVSPRVGSRTLPRRVSPVDRHGSRRDGAGHRRARRATPATARRCARRRAPNGWRCPRRRRRPRVARHRPRRRCGGIVPGRPGQLGDRHRARSR